MAANAAERRRHAARARARAARAARRQPAGRAPSSSPPTGEVLAEGWHRGAGNPHAEVDALSQLARTASPAARRRSSPSSPATTPAAPARAPRPCSPRASRASSTPSPTPARRPPAEPSGCAPPASTSRPGSAPSRRPPICSTRWLTVVQRLGRPHVTVKWAQSLDGRAAADDGTSQWITGPEARADVHRRRAAADAIVVGTGTVLADDPALTARHARRRAVRPPARCPSSSAIARVPDGCRAAAAPARSAAATDTPRPAPRCSTDLRDRGVQRVFVEGGPTLASAFVRAGPRRRRARLRRPRARSAASGTRSATSASRRSAGGADAVSHRRRPGRGSDRPSATIC